MTPAEMREREQLCSVGRSLFERGLTHGATGNLSVRTERGWLLTPTGASLGALDPASLPLVDADGRLLDGPAPTKEASLHLAVYRSRPRAAAIVHLHSVHSVAIACLADVDPADALPPLTAYYVMRVGRLPVVPYAPPGDPELADLVAAHARRHHALLLANHGPVVAGTSLAAAADAIEELEATARLYLLLRGHASRPLDAAQADALRARYPGS